MPTKSATLQLKVAKIFFPPVPSYEEIRSKRKSILIYGEGPIKGTHMFYIVLVLLFIKFSMLSVLCAEDKSVYNIIHTM